jgi:hypothetical protein
MEILFLPSGLEVLGVDTTFGGFLLFGQVGRHMTQNSEVFRGLIFAHTPMAFLQSHIRHPMQFIFDCPMPIAWDRWAGWKSSTSWHKQVFGGIA